MRRLCTLEVIDDEINNRDEISNSKTAPNRDVTTTPESSFKSPDPSETVQHSSLVDVFKTTCNSTSTHNVTEAEVTRNVTTNVTPVTNSCSDTTTEKLPTIVSNRQAYENIDKIPVPFWFVDKEKIREKTGDQKEEMDDFEYLGTLDDDYLLSLFSEEEEEERQYQPVCAQVSDEQDLSHDFSEKRGSVEENTTSTPTVADRSSVEEESECPVPSNSSTVTDSVLEKEDEISPQPVPDNTLHRRYNPPRLAKQGVTYCHDSSELEDILQSEYCKFCLLLFLFLSFQRCSVAPGSSILINNTNIFST